MAQHEKGPGAGGAEARNTDQLGSTIYPEFTPRHVQIQASRTKVRRGQRYYSVGTRPHLRRDGTLTTLAIWGTHCAECDEPFVFETTLRGRELSRRCPDHAKPGVRVTGGRR